MVAPIDNIEDIHKNLKKGLPNAKLPETYFKEVFLPVISGQRVPHEDENFVMLWVGIAGGWDRSVDIINGNGDVVITVPPLFSTQHYKVGEDTRPNISDLIRIINKAPANLQDTTAYEDALDKIIDNRSTGETVATEWSKVLEYYGINKTDSKVDNDEDDFLDY